MQSENYHQSILQRLGLKKEKPQDPPEVQFIELNKPLNLNVAGAKVRLEVVLEGQYPYQTSSIRISNINREARKSIYVNQTKLHEPAEIWLKYPPYNLRIGDDPNAYRNFTLGYDHQTRKWQLTRNYDNTLHHNRLDQGVQKAEQAARRESEKPRRQDTGKFVTSTLKSRKNIEDCVDAGTIKLADGVREQYVILADGAGGEKDGRWASYTAVDLVKKVFKDRNNRDTNQLKFGLTSAIHEFQQRAARRVGKESADNSKTAATMTAIKVRISETGDREGVVLHSGDSVAYAFGDSGMRRLTYDWNRVRGIVLNDQAQDDNHRSEASQEGVMRTLSYELDQVTSSESIQFLIDKYEPQILTPGTIRYLFENRNRMQTAFSSVEDAADSYDLFSREVIRPDDRFMLVVSDGVSDNLTFEEINIIVKQGIDRGWSANKICKEICKKAKQVSQDKAFRSKADDISAAGMYI